MSEVDQLINLSVSLKALSASLKELGTSLRGIPIENAPESFNAWETVGATIAGVLAGIAGSSFTEWLRYRTTQRAISRTARADLYKSLIEFKPILVESIEAINQARSNRTPIDPRLLIRMESSRQNVRNALLAFNDRRFLKRVGKILLKNNALSLQDRLMLLDRVITDLEPDALPYFELLIKETDTRI